jgi:antitoxin component of MazEF toxin-antitoxin module
MTQASEIKQKLEEISIESEKTQLVSLTYRKDEIMDLLAALNKALNENAHKSLSDQAKNDLSLKREKLSSELTSIDDELFDLEKKYGEFKRAKVVV